MGEFPNLGRDLRPPWVFATPCFGDIFLVTVRWVKV